jgi:hypothetical protein
MFNIYLGIYIVAALLIGGGGTFKLYGMGQSIAAFLFFVGALALFIIYGMRWFGGQDSIFSKTPVSWPPTINTCPDYLMYYSRVMPDGTTQDACIDTIGVSKNGTLSIFPKDEVPPQKDEFYFSLVTKSSDPEARKAELCQRAITYGLTWEGITNGESCVVPAAPTGSSAAAGGVPAGCPTK